MWIVSQPSLILLSFFIATNKQVSDLVNAYTQHERTGFEHEDLQFAKAVCCLKLICVVKVG